MPSIRYFRPHTWIYAAVQYKKGMPKPPEFDKWPDKDGNISTEGHNYILEDGDWVLYSKTYNLTLIRDQRTIDDNFEEVMYMADEELLKHIGKTSYETKRIP